MARKARQRISYGQCSSKSGIRLTHNVSATPGKFTGRTPLRGQWPRNRPRSLDSVRNAQTEDVVPIAHDFTVIREVEMV